MKLTQKQHMLLGFVTSYMTQHGRSPLIREIQEGCQVTSYKSVVDRLNSLERKGLLRRYPNKHRGIQLGQVRSVSQEIEPFVDISDTLWVVHPGSPQVE